MQHNLYEKENYLLDVFSDFKDIFSGKEVDFSEEVSIKVDNSIEFISECS